VSWKVAGFSKEVFGRVWEKVARLVVDEGSILVAPGLLNANMVASFSGPQKPHVGAILNSGKMTCDCLKYKSKSLHACSLVVAVKSGELVQLLQ